MPQDIHWLVTEDGCTPVRRARTTEIENAAPLVLAVGSRFVRVHLMSLEALLLTDDHAAFQAKLFGYDLAVDVYDGADGLDAQMLELTREACEDDACES